MNRYKEVVSLANQATIALASHNYENALEAYGNALKIAKELERSRLVAVLLDRTGRVLQAKGEIQDAVIAYETALRTLETGNNFEQVESITNRLSSAPKNFYSDPQPVPDLFSAKVAESLEADEQDSTLAIKLWLNVGNAYLQQPQEGPALNAYERALQYPEIAINPLLKAYAIANIGEIHRRQEKLDTAEAELKESLQLFDSQAAPLEKRRALALLAGIARDRKQFDEAEHFYQQALSLYDQAKDSLGMGRTYAGLARLYLEQQRFANAQQTYEHAVELAEAENDQDTLWHAYWGLGCCQHIAGQLKEAIASFQKSLDLIEQRQQDLRTDEGKVTFLDSVKDVFDKLLTVHLELSQAEGQDYKAALAVAESARGRALRDLMEGNERRRPSLQTPHPETTLDANPLDIRQAAIGVESNPFSNMAVQAAVGVPINPWDDTVVQPAPASTEGTPAAIASNQPEAEQSIPKVLPLARLVFYVLLDRIAVFAVTPDGTVCGHVVSVGCHELEARVAHLRRALNVDEASRGAEVRKLFPVSEDIEPVEVPAVKLETLLQAFYTELVAPVADALPTDGTPLVIEPHASLWLVPFAALQLSDGSWMSDRWTLLYAASAQTLTEIRREPCYATIDRSKLLVVGNPVMPKVITQDGFEITLEPLAGAEEEARSIVESLFEHEHTLLIGAEATEAAVKDLALKHNIVHLATHGIAYTEDPLASFVAFSPTATENGLLTAREVASNRSLPCDLVVLSACQTGLGRVSGDGMLGLSRAFLVAGARTVVVSQWSVSDSATMELMVAFYKNYFQHGNKAIALQQATQTVRSQVEYAHPRYWAAFVTVGAEI